MIRTCLGMNFYMSYFSGSQGKRSAILKKAYISSCLKFTEMSGHKALKLIKAIQCNQIVFLSKRNLDQI